MTTARASRATARRAAAPPAAPVLPEASRIAGRRPWQQHLLAVIVLWIAFAAVFPEITLQGKVFLSPDYDSPSYFGDAGRAALGAGEYPLWNPYLFLGMPSFASLSFTPYVYSPSEILAALGKLPLAPPLLWLIFYYVAAGYGVFLLLRYAKCEMWPALVGGAAYMLLPHLVSMGVFGHGSKLASAVYLPYLALLALRLRVPGRRLLWTGLLGLAIGLLLLRGHPQVAFYGLLLVGLLAVVEIVAGWRARAPRGDLVRYAAGIGAAVALGFALAAVVLLPVRAYARVSIRGAGEGGGAAYQYATNWSFSIGEIATFFLPSAAGFGEGTYVGTMPFTNFPNYLGVAALLFGVAALVLLRGRSLVFWVLLGVLALFVSFGRNFPLVYDLLYKHLPYFNKFRVPVMILVLQQLATCVLLGLGLSALWGRLPRDAAWRRAPGPRDAARLLVMALAAAVFIVVLVQPWSGSLAQRVQQSPRLPAEARAPYGEIARQLLQRDGLRVGLFLVLQAGAVWLLWRRRLPADVAGVALCALTVLDLGVVDRKMVAPERTWPGAGSRVGNPSADTSTPSPLVRFLQSQPGDGAAPLRILPPGPDFMNNEWMRWGIASAGGYHPAKLSRFEELVDTRRQTLDPALLDLFAVRYVVLPERSPRAAAAPAYEGPEGAVYENSRAMPRAWVTGRWELADAAQCRTRLLAPEFDRTRVALLESSPEPAPDTSAVGTARIVEFAANRLALEVESSTPALLVLSEAYHPGWRARVNGDARPVLPADCVLRAVTLPAGASRVELEFTDPALRRGLAVTLSALAVVVGLVLAGIFRGRGARPGGATSGLAEAG